MEKYSFHPSQPPVYEKYKNWKARQKKKLIKLEIVEIYFFTV